MKKRTAHAGAFIFSSGTMIALLLVLLGVQPGFGQLSVVSYLADTGGVTFRLNTGLMRLTVCRDDILRLTYAPGTSFPAKTSLVVNAAWTAHPFTTAQTGDTITLQTGRVKAKVNTATAAVTYTDLSDNVILSENSKSMTAATVDSASTYTCRTVFNSPASEGLYGLGQHMHDGGGGSTIMNYKGHNDTMTQYYGGQGNQYYSPIPVLVSTMGYGIMWDNYSKSWFHGGDTNNTRYTYISQCGSLIDYYFFYGPQLDTVIQRYRATTGHAPLFAKWTYGFIQSYDHYFGTAALLAVKNGYRGNNIPIDCIVQDWQWWGSALWGSNTFDPTAYPNPAAPVDSLHNANIHTMISIWPLDQSPCPNYLALNAIGAMWPLESPSATHHFWDAYSDTGLSLAWNQIRDQVLAKYGWDAWWIDSDEPGPIDGDNFDRDALMTAMGRGCLYDNTYSLRIVTQDYPRWRRDIPGKRAFLFSRAIFAGQQRGSSASWNSDISSTWPTFVNCIPCGLNVFLSGDPYWCTDIGGYWGGSVNWSLASNRELFTRWFQYGAFLPIFRVHGQGSKELYTSAWDSTTKANLLTMDQLRYRLLPYIYSLAWMVTNNDYTLCRHLVMDFPTDANVMNIPDQFMFGPALLVNPVTAQGATTRSVYLPAGIWCNFWTNFMSIGPQTVTASAPLSQIPLFVRAGSIIPLGPNIQYATQRADTIELRVYAGANGQFTIYEDENDNYDYESGAYATIPITYTDNPKRLTIGARSGSFPGMLQNRVFNVVFAATGHGAGPGVTANPDYVVNYSGAAVTVPPTGIAAQGRGGPALSAASVTMKTAQEIVQLPRDFAGRMNEIAVYDVHGRLVGMKTMRACCLDMAKDFGAGMGVYIIKVKALQPGN
jgi:alpha-D-xyloside xylohydrolase